MIKFFLKKLLFGRKKNQDKATKKFIFVIIPLIGIFVSCNSNPENRENLNDPAKKLPVEKRAWNILSDNREKALLAIDKARSYNINHLQLSHRIIMDLKDVRDTAKSKLANLLTRRAHQSGISEVVLWDHALYELDYYPDSIKTGPGNAINLDDPVFWEWFKNDYREMLDYVPSIDGLVLTFNETGAQVEDQYSTEMPGEAAKLAALVDSLASVVMDERNLNLYIRTFIYTKQQLDNIIKCLELIEHDDIVVMMKETPHDFFLTHPPNKFVEKIDKPVLIEFDAAQEYNGQGIVANTFVDLFRDRWKYFLNQDNVIGYVARTDRYGDTQIVGRPSEILLATLDKLAYDSTYRSHTIYQDFISGNYGEKAVNHLELAFRKAEDIITSVFYTLGLNTVDHSRLEFDNIYNYTRHVSARWMENNEIFIDHNIGRSFHYWRDIVNHLAPLAYKRDTAFLKEEIPEVVANNWLDEDTGLTMKYLQYIVSEKNYGVEQAEEALQHVIRARPFLNNKEDYKMLYHTFNRTVITAKIRRACAKAHFGLRLYQRGPAYRDATLNHIIREGIEEIKNVSKSIENYPVEAPGGQWNWADDAERAMEYREKVLDSNWSG